MAIELVSIIIEEDGHLAYVVIPDGCSEMIIRFLAGMSDNKTIKVIKLPEEFEKVPLSDALK